MTPHHALMLDLDGTLADSLGAMRAVYDRFLDGFGLVGSDAEFARLNGPPLPDIIDTLKVTHALPGDAASLLAAYRALVQQSYEGILPNAGAQRLLEAAIDSGWTTVLVTSNYAELARHWLGCVHLDDLVEVIVGMEAANRGKPHPDLYLAGLRDAGARAELSVAVEDSPQGATAALKAGIKTFVIDPAGQARSGRGDWPRGLAGTIDRLDALVVPLRLHGER